MRLKNGAMAGLFLLAFAVASVAPLLSSSAVYAAPKSGEQGQRGGDDEGRNGRSDKDDEQEDRRGDQRRDNDEDEDEKKGEREENRDERGERGDENERDEGPRDRDDEKGEIEDRRGGDEEDRRGGDEEDRRGDQRRDNDEDEDEKKGEREENRDERGERGDENERDEGPRDRDDEKGDHHRDSGDKHRDDDGKKDDCRRDCQERPKYVTPQPPVQTVVCGPENDIVTTPDIKGVKYLKKYKDDGVMYVMAVPMEGYKFKRDVQTKWRFVDESTLCPVALVAPADPTVVCGANNDTIVLPEDTEMVSYTQTGWVDGKNTVTATAAEGYYIEGTEGETAMEWTYTDENTSCGQVLGDTTTTPKVLGATLEDTGANTNLVTFMSMALLGLGIATMLQSSKRKLALPVATQRALGRMRTAFTEPFVLPSV